METFCRLVEKAPSALHWLRPEHSADMLKFLAARCILEQLTQPATPRTLCYVLAELNVSADLDLDFDGSRLQVAVPRLQLVYRRIDHNLFRLIGGGNSAIVPLYAAFFIYRSFTFHEFKTFVRENNDL